jgi:hypothetical protein
MPLLPISGRSYVPCHWAAYSFPAPTTQHATRVLSLERTLSHVTCWHRTLVCGVNWCMAFATLTYVWGTIPLVTRIIQRIMEPGMFQSNWYYYTCRYRQSEKAFLCFKILRLHQFVLLVRAMCRWRWVWSIAGMILTGETEVLGQKYYTALVVDVWMSMGHWWNDTDRGNWITGRQTCPSATTNPIQNILKIKKLNYI